ncbi:carbohydrate kinase [Sphingomonas sp. Leaf17]|uniref:bifunctional ADP-dependent NAD(P)H-hydrate dehydratase/NAD(P)H-hydrate epimerase n=1 Tax=Sphingomonas sp. Leaf17 TaxID=1735683 RepID=UPI0006F3BD05|nr:bifunctional ADP-dependent NAD(P)H-hydrate dehydratase/NAD(P)H-hydrate epimerase [Sphingomonas sp. Leaf17]KQM65837.1 carbohydrate kinase [Sphingomonas sp. Leaf17]
MIPITGQPILTVAAMHAAEAALIAREGLSIDTLMTRAGTAIAGSVRRLSGGSEVLILCGPGNNGGDGYVAASILRCAGVSVRVAASGPPTAEAAIRARAGWDAPVAPMTSVSPAPVLVDAVFGTGLARPVEPALSGAIGGLLDHAPLSIAVDVPSGIAGDTGALLAGHLRGRAFTLTLALGAVKPAHVLEPATGVCGTIRLLDIGIDARDADTRVIAPPSLPAPTATSHKYNRGMVAIVVGDMPGAARLAAVAAARAGAGYVALYGDAGRVGPDALVHRPLDDDALREPRIGAILIGPGLGRTREQADLLRRLIAEDRHPLVIDGDALHLLDPARLTGRRHPVILTPHAGEFTTLFGASDASPMARARDAAGAINATIVFKGATTVIATDARMTVSPRGDPWLSTAGTGDVLAGAIAAMLAAPGADPHAAAAAGVWLHAAAARAAGPAFIADDLAAALSAARGSA